MQKHVLIGFVEFHANPGSDCRSVYFIQISYKKGQCPLNLYGHCYPTLYNNNKVIKTMHKLHKQKY